jgi:hypothetical protein
MISIIAQLASKETKVCDLFYYVVINSFLLRANIN